MAWDSLCSSVYYLPQFYLCHCSLTSAVSLYRPNTQPTYERVLSPVG
jgi:hypothetical protein